MTISVSSYSFQQYIGAGKMTQLDCVAKAKEIGFDAIEFIDIDGKTYEEKVENAKKIRAEADRVGIMINAYTISACLFGGSEEADKAEIERLKRQLDIAKILGAPVMRHDVCRTLGKSGKARSFDLMLPTIAKNARAVTEYAETLGIRTCTENHGIIAQDSDRVERLFNAVAHDNYGLLVDIGNFICVDENPVTAVSRVAPYAIHAHVKDMIIRETPIGNCRNATRGCNYFCGAVVGEGDIPVKKCLAVLKKAGYSGCLSVEYEGSEDCIAGIKRGLANLKGILSELAWS